MYLSMSIIILSVWAGIKSKSINYSINYLIILFSLIDKLINYYVLKQETELLIPAQTGNRTMKMYTSIERILSVDH